MIWSRYALRALTFFLWLSTQSFAVSSAGLPDGVLVRTRWIELTQADFDEAVAKMPARIRPEIAASSERVKIILNQLLINKTLAAQARARGVAVDPTIAAADQTRELAAVELQKAETDAGLAFDAQKDKYEARAHEIYLVERERFRMPASARFSDIAIALKGRTDEEALARAKEARARVVAGEDFGAVAAEMSDDPVSRARGGALPFVTRAQLDPAYATGAFALTREGEISQPIKAPAAYHVVRLEELRPARVATFDEVRSGLLEQLRSAYVAEQRDARMKAIYTDVETEVNQPAIDALVKRADPPLVAPATNEGEHGTTSPGTNRLRPNRPAGG